MIILCLAGFLVMHRWKLLDYKFQQVTAPWNSFMGLEQQSKDSFVTLSVPANLSSIAEAVLVE
ncbi:hypothetical protein Hte_003526 [Hypoxylon texense]